jgi:hypothetical protein
MATMTRLPPVLKPSGQYDLTGRAGVPEPLGHEVLWNDFKQNFANRSERAE